MTSLRRNVSIKLFVSLETATTIVMLVCCWRTRAFKHHRDSGLKQNVYQAGGIRAHLLSSTLQFKK